MTESNISIITGKVHGSGWTKDDRNTYMRGYMKAEYDSNPIEKRKYKNSLLARRSYNVNDKDWKEWGSDLANIIKAKEVIDSIPAEVFQKFMLNYNNIQFNKKVPVENIVKYNGRGRPKKVETEVLEE